MDKSSKQYQKDISDIITLLEIQHSELLRGAKLARMGGDKLLEEAAWATKVSGLMKDLQTLTYGTPQQRALSALDRHQLASLNALTRILPNGQHINLINPTDEQLDLPVIICNLGNLTRFGGSAQQFGHKPFTVAHHLLLGLWIIENMQHVPTSEVASVKRYWLAHDAQEGSLGFDLITPVKTQINILAGWDILKYIEDNHSKPIHEKLGLIWPVPDAINTYVKKIDNICVCTEAKYLLHDPCEWAVYANPLPERLFADFMLTISAVGVDAARINMAFEQNFECFDRDAELFFGFGYEDREVANV